MHEACNPAQNVPRYAIAEGKDYVPGGTIIRE
jgi:hypothetical protein